MYRNPLPPPAPDLSSGSTGLQMATSIKDTSMGMSSQGASNTAPRAKPSVPQKKTHIDELLRLRKELEESREAVDQAHRERDAMADDLLKFQEDVEEKDEELRTMSKEIWALREQAEKLTKDMTDEKRVAVKTRSPIVGGSARSPMNGDLSTGEVAELAHARQQVQQLTAALAESQAQLSAKMLAVPNAEAVPQASSDDLQRQIQAQLTQADERWRSHIAAEQHRLREASDANSNMMREYYENKLKSIETQVRSQVEAETRLQGGMQQMEIDSKDDEELDRLRRVTADQENRANDQHQCAEQYRRMSERLTTQVKQANSAMRGLEQSEQMMRQQMEGMKAEIRTLKLPHRSNMPGAFR